MPQDKKKFFIIEDDANILYGLQAKLNLAGFVSLLSFGNTTIDDILSRMYDEKPDYIILDLILPNLNGFELLGAIKKEEYFSGIPIFVFTNLSDEDAKKKSELYGINYYFLKSELNIDELVGRIVKIIKNQKL